MSLTITSYRKEPFVLQDKTDNTKKLKFDLSNLSTDTTSTLIAPNRDGTIGLNNNNDWAFVTLASDQSLGSGSVKVNFNSKIADPGNNFDASNNWYTAPFTGLYHISYQITINNVGAPAFADFVHSFVGGGNEVIFRKRVPTHPNNIGPAASHAWILEMTAGDRLHARMRVDVTPRYVIADKLNTWFTIHPFGHV
jgi:hypothetical protein